MGNSIGASLNDNSQPTESERKSADKTKSGTAIGPDSSKKGANVRRKSWNKYKISDNSSKTKSTSSSNTNQDFSGELKFDHIAIKQNSKPQPSIFNQYKVTNKTSKFYDCNQTLPHLPVNAQIESKPNPETEPSPRNTLINDLDSHRYSSGFPKGSGIPGGAKIAEKMPFPVDKEFRKPATTARVKNSELSLSSQCSSSVFPHASLIMEEARDAELRYIVPKPTDTELEKNAGTPLKKTTSETPLKTQKPKTVHSDDDSFNSCRVTYLYSHKIGSRSKNAKIVSGNRQKEDSVSERRLFKDPPSLHVHLSKPANVKSCIEGKVAEKNHELKKLQNTNKNG